MKFYLSCIIFFSMMSVSAVYGGIDEKKTTTTIFKGVTVTWERYQVKKDDHLFQLFRSHGNIGEKDLFNFLKKFKTLNPTVEDVDNLEPGQQILIPNGKSDQYEIFKVSKQKLAGPSNAKPLGKAAFTSKGYVTRKYRNIEVLCDYYSVKKGDYIFSLFRTKGEIAEKDLIEFLAIFKAINPSIRDADRVLPGQQILIPLKKIKPHTLPGQDTGVVNLPHIKISEKNISPVAPAPEAPVSTLSPESKTVGRIVKETDIKKSILNEKINIRLNSSGSLYFPRKGNSDYKLDLSKHPVLQFAGKSYFIMDKENGLPENEREVIRSFWHSVRFLTKEDSGEHSFPKVDDNGVSLVTGGDWLVSIPTSDHGSEKTICITSIDDEAQQTSPFIFKYLAQRDIFIRDWLYTEKRFISFNEVSEDAVDSDHLTHTDIGSFVASFAKLLECDYTENVTISFSYAGFKVDAISNVIKTGGEKELFVDFEDLYGDAVPEIVKNGVNIITIKKDTDPNTAMDSILTALDFDFTRDPVFLAADRPGNKTVSITLPGILISEKKGKKTLLTGLNPGNEILGFLNEKEVRVVIIDGRINE